MNAARGELGAAEEAEREPVQPLPLPFAFGNSRFEPVLVPGDRRREAFRRFAIQSFLHRQFVRRQLLRHRLLQVLEGRGSV